MNYIIHLISAEFGNLMGDSLVFFFFCPDIFFFVQGPHEESIETSEFPSTFIERKSEFVVNNPVTCSMLTKFGDFVRFLSQCDYI